MRPLLPGSVASRADFDNPKRQVTKLIELRYHSVGASFGLTPGVCHWICHRGIEMLALCCLTKFLNGLLNLGPQWNQARADTKPCTGSTKGNSNPAGA